MRVAVRLMVVSALFLAVIVVAAPPSSGRNADRRTPGMASPGGELRPPPPGPRQCPPDIVFFGVSRKGDETKPFLLSVQPPMPGPEGANNHPEQPRKPQVMSGSDRGQDPLPPPPHGFLSINGQGHWVTKVQIAFVESDGRQPMPPMIKSIKAAILDAAPPIVDPAVMERKTEAERQEIGKKCDDDMRAAKEIGSLELNFVMRRDLKSPIMTDIEILMAEGQATVNGEECKLVFLAPPPPPGPRGRGEGPESNRPEPGRDDPVPDDRDF